MRKSLLSAAILLANAPIMATTGTAKVIKAYDLKTISNASSMPKYPSAPRHTPGQKWSQPKRRRMARAHNMTVKQAGW